MKPLFVCLSIVLLVSVAFAEPDVMPTHDAEMFMKPACPTTQMTEQCLLCHTTPSFKLKEADPFEAYDLPRGLEMVRREGKAVAYYLCEDVDPEQMRRAFEYLNRHDLTDTVIIELHNPGGMVFDGWRCVNLIQHWSSRFHIETHLYGMAFSAGFLIFEAGEHRYTAPRAELMWHEAAVWEMGVTTPSGSEDKAEMMRHLQDNANEWIAERTNGMVTKERIDSKIKMNRLGWWLNGLEAIENGFADGTLEDSEYGRL